MKTKIVFLITMLTLLVMLQGFEQTSPPREIKTLKLSKQMTAALLKVQVKAFELNKYGILRAKSGYHIVFDKATQRIYIKIRVSEINPTIAADEGKEILKGVMMKCMGCDSCKVKSAPSGSQSGATTYSCQPPQCNDETGCDEFVTISPSTDVQYETSGGGYSGNW